jgi:hypothetical protein
MKTKTKSLADQLRIHILSSELTKYRICKSAGLDQSQMNRFMARKASLSLDSMSRVCDVLQLELRKKGE